MAAEEWRQVIGYEGLYEVSSNGRVTSLERTVDNGKGHTRNLRALEMKPHRDNHGYLIVTLSKNAKTKARKVHRLVCEAFHGPCPPGLICAHRDGQRDNNRAANLRWSTPKENSADAILHGTVPHGVTHPWAKLTPEQVREAWLSPLGTHALAKQMGVTKATLHAVRTGQTWARLTSALPPPPDRSANHKTKIPVPPGAMELLANGMSRQKVAEQFGVSETTVFRWKKAA